jgi:hypothetical protein
MFGNMHMGGWLDESWGTAAQTSDCTCRMCDAMTAGGGLQRDGTIRFGVKTRIVALCSDSGM